MGRKARREGNSICKGSEPYHIKLEDRLLDRIRQEHKALNLYLKGHGQIPWTQFQEWGRDHSSSELQVHLGVQPGYLGTEVRDSVKTRKSVSLQSLKEVT